MKSVVLCSIQLFYSLTDGNSLVRISVVITPGCWLKELRELLYGIMGLFCPSGEASGELERIFDLLLSLAGLCHLKDRNTEMLETNIIMNVTKRV